MGFIYLVIFKTTGFALFCPFNKLTGLKCPGCGISRMFLNIFRLDFYSAFLWNPMVFCLLPVGGVMYVLHQYRYIRYNDKTFKKWENILLYIMIFLLLIFGILRNIL